MKPFDPTKPFKTRDGRDMRIEVTQEDIAQGKAQDCFLCPVSLAVARAARAIGVQVFSAVVAIENIIVTATNGAVMVFGTPQAVAEFIMAFDRGKPVQPFTFELSPPPTCQPQQPESANSQSADPEGEGN